MLLQELRTPVVNIVQRGLLRGILHPKLPAHPNTHTFPEGGEEKQRPHTHGHINLCLNSDWTFSPLLTLQPGLSNIEFSLFQIICTKIPLSSACSLVVFFLVDRITSLGSNQWEHNLTSLTVNLMHSPSEHVPVSHAGPEGGASAQAVWNLKST